MPAAPTAPPPTAPAAPAPATTGKPSAPPAGGGNPMDRQDSSESSWLQEAGAELEQLDTDTNKPRPPRPAQGPARREAPKPAPEQEVKPTEQSPEDNDVINMGEETPVKPKPSAEQPPAGGEQERPMRAPELRKAYEETKGKLAERDTELATLRARVSELEQAGPKDTEQTQGRMKHLEERNKKLEEFVRLKHFEQSEEYQEKFQKPYQQAWEKCLRDINQLEVSVQGKDGEYITRKATDADVTYLAQLATTNLSEYYKVSNAMFGDAAEVIRKHVDRINETWEGQNRAIEEATKRSKDLGQQEQTQAAEQNRVKQKLWEDNNTELASKFPTFFAPIQGDDSGNKLLNSGFAFTDLLFQSATLTPDKLALLPPKYRQAIETNGRLSPELTVRAHAIIRNKAANHDRLARDLKRARTELEDTKKKLSQYEESEPTVGGEQPGRARGGASGGHWSEEYNSELDELSRKGPQ